MHISPNLTITRKDANIVINGNVTVPRADVDFSKLPGGGVSQASPDIVVTDAERAPDAASAPIIADITVKLGAGEKLDMDLRQGQEVHLVGFGLNGYLERTDRRAGLSGPRRRSAAVRSSSTEHTRRTDRI